MKVVTSRVNLSAETFVGVMAFCCAQTSAALKNNATIKKSRHVAENEIMFIDPFI